MDPVAETQTAPVQSRDVFPVDALLIRVMLVFLGTLMLALSAIYLLRQPGSEAFIWYANGLCIAMIAIAPQKQRLALVGTAFVAILLANLIFGDDPVQSVHLSLANVMTIACGVYSLVYISRDGDPFLQLRPFVAFVALTAFASPIVGAVFGGLALQYAVNVPFSAVAPAWYLGDVIGIISTTPLVYGLLQSQRDIPSSVYKPVTVALMIAIASFSGWMMIHAAHPFIAIAIALTMASAVLDRLSAFTTAFLVCVTLDLLLLNPAENLGASSEIFEHAGRLLPIAGAMLLGALLAVKSAQLTYLKKQSDERSSLFANAMQSSVIGTVVVQPDGFMHNANHAFIDLTGFSVKELKQKTFNQLVFHRDKCTLSEQLATFSDPKTESCHVELRLTRKNKQVIWTRLGVTAVRDQWTGAITQYVFQIQNIDRERRFDDERKLWSKKFEFALSINRTALYEMECHTKYIHLSDNAFRAIGVRSSDIRRLYEWMARIHPEDLREYQHAVTRIGSETITIEYRLMDDEKCFRWVRDHCQPIEHDNNGITTKVIGTISDIQEEKVKSEQEIMATKYSEVVDLVCDLGVWEFTPKSGTLYWNPRMYSLYGISEGELMTIDMWRDHLLSSDRAILDSVFGMARLNDGQIEVNVQRLTPEGSTISHNILAKVIHDNQGTRLVGLCKESTSLQKRNMVLSQNNAQLTAAIDVVSDGVIILDSLFHITSVNEKALRLTKEERSVLLGEHIDQHFNIFNRETQFTFAHLFSAYQKEFKLNGTFTLQTRQGVEVKVYLEATPVIAAGDAPNGWVLSFHGVQQDLEKNAATDSELESGLKDVLTGLLNRRGLEHVLQNHIDNLHKQANAHCFAMIEFRGLTAMSNALGAPVSDQVIKSAALILKSHLNAKGTLARISNDQFGALLEGSTIAEGRTKIAAIIEKLGAIDYPQSGNFPLQYTAGITGAESANNTPFQMIYQSQIALDSVTEGINPAIAVFDKATLSEGITSKRNNLLQHIDSAIANSSFSLLSMPMIPTDDKQATWHEVLIRLITEDGKLLMPDEFLAAAEPTGRLSIIETWVFNEVLIENGTALRDANLHITVNISTGTFYNERFIKQCLNMIERSTLPASQLCIEVKESTLLIDVLRAKEIVTAFRKLGCEVAVDNFGAELTSFNYLRKFNISLIKIDGAIISLMKSSQVDRRIVESIKQICESLHVKTAAQKINDETDLKLVREIGLDFSQGYVFGEPTPLSRLISVTQVGLNDQAANLK